MPFQSVCLAATLHEAVSSEYAEGVLICCSAWKYHQARFGDRVTNCCKCANIAITREILVRARNSCKQPHRTSQKLPNHTLECRSPVTKTLVNTHIGRPWHSCGVGAECNTHKTLSTCDQSHHLCTWSYKDGISTIVVVVARKMSLMQTCYTPQFTVSGYRVSPLHVHIMWGRLPVGC